jgi:DNA invertase Pin-like site-specific DNA recombinase
MDGKDGDNGADALLHLHLIESVNSLEEQGIGLQSLPESIYTTTSGSKLIFHIFSALAEFERNLIRERTHAGLARLVPAGVSVVDLNL